MCTSGTTGCPDDSFDMADVPGSVLPTSLPIAPTQGCTDRQSGNQSGAGSSPRWRAAQPSLTVWRERAMARASAGTSSVMVDPAAT